MEVKSISKIYRMPLNCFRPNKRAKSISDNINQKIRNCKEGIMLVDGTKVFLENAGAVPVHRAKCGKDVLPDVQVTLRYDKGKDIVEAWKEIDILNKIVISYFSNVKRGLEIYFCPVYAEVSDATFKGFYHVNYAGNIRNEDICSDNNPTLTAVVNHLFFNRKEAETELSQADRFDLGYDRTIIEFSKGSACVLRDAPKVTLERRLPHFKEGDEREFVNWARSLNEAYILTLNSYFDKKEKCAKLQPRLSLVEPQMTADISFHFKNTPHPIAATYRLLPEAFHPVNNSP